MDGLALLASLMAAIGVTCAAFAIRHLVRGDRDAAESRVLVLYGQAQKAADENAGAEALMRRKKLNVRLLSVLFARAEQGRDGELMLERAGLSMRPGKFLLIRIVLAAIAFILAWTFAGSGMVRLAAVLFAPLVAYFLPRMYVGRRAGSRIRGMEGQFVDLLTLTASSLRSGFSLLQAFDTAAKRMGSPLAEEIDRILSDVRFGRTMDDALQDWTVRIPSRDLQLIVTAIGVQRHSGGNLAEVLENLAETMRERVEIRQQISSLTAYPRFASRIVAGYPLAIAALLSFMSPEIWNVLWTEPAGYAMLGAAFGLDLLAFFMLSKIIRVDY